MKLSLDGNDLLLAGTITDWDDFALTRWNQGYWSAAGEAVIHAADQIYAGSNGGRASSRWSGIASLNFRIKRKLTRQERNDLARDLKIIAAAMANNGSRQGAVGGLRWRFELEKSEAETEPEGEAA